MQKLSSFACPEEAKTVCIAGMIFFFFFFFNPTETEIF